MREKISSGINHVATEIALFPGKAITTLFPDNGPGGPGYTFVMLTLGAVATLPVTLPMFMVAHWIKPKE